MDSPVQGEFQRASVKRPATIQQSVIGLAIVQTWASESGLTEQLVCSTSCQAQCPERRTGWDRMRLHARAVPLPGKTSLLRKMRCFQ